jgi:GWxTD domain-containing protein
VRVGTFRETSRTDESIVFQQLLAAPPGTYDLAVSVRDEGSARTGGQTLRIVVPRLAAGALSTPIPAYEARPRLTTDSLPGVVANPRGTVFFGRDSVATVYLEGYGLPTGAEALVEVRGDRDAILWSDSVALAGPGAVRAAAIPIPVPVLGVGRMTLVARAGAAEMRAPLFVTFGDEWGITSLDEMLNYLRWFATPGRLAKLRDDDPQARAQAWAAFFRETDPEPRTPEHEALRDYFTRVQFASERFTEEGTPGWLTDRGEVYVTLGDPDQVLEQGDGAINTRGRTQLWVYGRHRLQLVFVDQTGFGRWRLTPGSQSDFNLVAMRERR